jgi:hypothetical protein
MVVQHNYLDKIILIKGEDTITEVFRCISQYYLGRMCCATINALHNYRSCPFL